MSENTPVGFYDGEFLCLNYKFVINISIIIISYSSIIKYKFNKYDIIKMKKYVYKGIKNDINL